MSPPKLISVTKTDPLTLICEWDECNENFESMKEFMSHVTDHLHCLIPHEIIPNQEAESYTCLWRECGHEPVNDFHEIVRHVYFHAFHIKLKSYGTSLILKNKLRNCLLDVSSRNVIPELPERFQCGWKYCQAVYDNPELFYIHVRSHCEVYPQKRVVEGGCACEWEDCKANKKNSLKLKEHVKSHTQEKNIACPTCGSLFSSASKLHDHILRQSESEVQNYQCSHCDKKFATERILRDHMRHHVNHYKCSYCEMTLPSPSALRNHVTYRHSEARPYLCDHCEYSAKTVKDLKCHQEIHNGIQVECGIGSCKFQTPFLSRLNLHYRQKHGGDISKSPYKCHLCGKNYHRGAKLTDHLKKKHNFQWPPGHNRFNYKLCVDGYYRLQTVRYESVELTERKQREAKLKEKSETCSSLQESTHANKNNQQVLNNNQCSSKTINTSNKLLHETNNGQTMQQTQNLANMQRNDNKNVQKYANKGGKKKGQKKKDSDNAQDLLKAMSSDTTTQGDIQSQNVNNKKDECLDLSYNLDLLGDVAIRAHNQETSLNMSKNSINDSLNQSKNSLNSSANDSFNQYVEQLNTEIEQTEVEIVSSVNKNAPKTQIKRQSNSPTQQHNKQRIIEENRCISQNIVSNHQTENDVMVYDDLIIEDSKLPPKKRKRSCASVVNIKVESAIDMTIRKDGNDSMNHGNTVTDSKANLVLPSMPQVFPEESLGCFSIPSLDNTSHHEQRPSNEHITIESKINIENFPSEGAFHNLHVENVDSKSMSARKVRWAHEKSPPEQCIRSNKRKSRKPARLIDEDFEKQVKHLGISIV